MCWSNLIISFIIVGYKLFINGVDRFGNYRATTTTMRKRARFSMNIFTFILNSAVIKFHTVLNAIILSGAIILFFDANKYNIIQKLVYM